MYWPVGSGSEKGRLLKLPRVRLLRLLHMKVAVLQICFFACICPYHR